MPDEYRIVGTLTNFGAEADHKHVKKSPFTLQGNNGAWVTIPGDQYRVERRTGLVVLREIDDSNAFVDWETYDPEFGGGGWRVTYTVNDNGTQTTYTNESITFAEEDSGVVVIGSDGAVNAGLISNLLVIDTDLGNETVTGQKIANATITATNIANATITAAQIANATISGANIQAATITGGNIAAATVAGSNIANATITAAQIASGTITAGNIAAGTITGGNIAAGTIMSGNIASGTITAGNIQNLTITAAQIANLTITASQIANYTLELRTFTQAMIDALSNADARNQTFNNGFENGSTFWLLEGTGTVSVQTNAANAHGGNKYLEITMNSFFYRASQADEAGALRYYEVRPGQVVRGSAWAYRVSGDHTIWIGVETFDANKSHVAWNASPNVSSTGVWTQTSIEVTIPTGVKYVTFYVEIQNGTTTTTARFDDAEMFILLPGLDIVANSITATQIAAGTITGSNIAAGTITASNIATGTITATQLNATAIDSMTITGATIRTASSGARTEMNASNLFGLGFGGVGGTDGTTTQWYAKSGDGKIYAGGGNVTLDANGLRMDGGAYAGSKTLSWYFGPRVGEAYVSASATITDGGFQTVGSVGTAAAVARLMASSYDGGTQAQIYAHVTQNSGLARLFANTHLVFETDAAHDIGASGGNRPRTLYLGSTLYLDETSNSFGAANSITVNQGNNNAEAFAVKRTSVAHAMTSLTETDTYFNVAPAQTTSGGANLRGYSASTIGLRMDGHMTTGNTTRSTAAVGAVVINGEKKSGGASAALGANENILVVRDADATRFLVDAEGDIHMDATSNIDAWDDYDDVALLEAFRVKTAGVNFQKQFARDIDAHARTLHDTGVLTLNEDGHHFASIKGLFGLTIDAIRQLSRKTERYERALLALGVDVNQLSV